MAEFTEIETKLIERYIQDSSLLTSLRLIRESMEKLWENTPQIVRYYPDHGNKHCERLAYFVDKLLEVNGGKELREYEMYILLAGIYLHDIGMQCDVVKFPQIKKEAENLGAEFEVDFTASVAGDYSIEEQNCIRKNHQYLSAAWISYAYKNGDTKLGTAMKTVPYTLVLDLMDVCKYHSKLPITICENNFTIHREMRKKLVAALLRFSDELDIDSNRVSIDTVINFSFDPRNSLYWWLHHLTTISFSDKNHILLTVALSPEDMKNYGVIIQQEYIENFKSKNQILLDTLSREGILILIDNNSKVEQYEFSKKLPVEITTILDTLQKRDDPLVSLADEVKMWLQIIKFEITESNRFNERIIDLKTVNPYKQNLLIRCIGGEISDKDVNDLDKLLDRKTPQGWLISDKRVTQKARLRASEDNAFEVLTLDEFLKQKVWGSYFDTLEHLVKKELIPELYVDIGCYKEKMENGKTIRDVENRKTIKDEYPSIDDYIDRWLIERGKTHMSLLGDFGTGKTWFCRHYAYRQLNRYLKDPVNQRFPLLITLSDFIKATTVQQLINDALLEKYKLPFIGSAFDAFKEMNRQGKLLLILDGFDEMAQQVDYQTVVDNFWELAKLVEENSKVILTSRNEYFRWAEESEKVFAGKELGRYTISLPTPKFEVLYLNQLTDDQIREIIIKKKGSEKGTAIAERVLSKENLAALARKPVLIELLLASLDEVDDAILENPAQIYLYSTNKLLLRNIKTERTFTTTADKLFFLSELAWEMIKNSELKIHYSEIPNRINSYFKLKIKDKHELDTWDFDLRNQTLLHRNAAGYYEFSHKSLAEYFVAFKFASELEILSPLYKKTYLEADGTYCKIPVKSRKIGELKDTFGYLSLTNEKMKAVYELLCEMISDESDEKLWQIIEFTRNKSFEDVKYLGGNAATLLSQKNKNFDRANLENTVLCGADLSESNLLTADVNGCDLRHANLLKSLFDEKILNANLERNQVLMYSKQETNHYDDSLEVRLNKLSEEFSNLQIGHDSDIEIMDRHDVFICVRDCNLREFIRLKENISEKFSFDLEIYFDEHDEQKYNTILA